MSIMMLFNSIIVSCLLMLINFVPGVYSSLSHQHHHVSEPKKITSPSGNALYYEMPEGSAKGVVLTLHGCHHGAHDFWPVSTVCPECYGLPVGITTSSTLVKKGFVFAAITTTAATGCWSPISDSIQFDEILALINKQFYGKPLFLYGISAGGSFISSMLENWAADGLLGDKIKIAGVCLHVSAMQHIPKDRSQLPPVFFAPMIKDHPSTMKAKHAIKNLQQGRRHASAFYLEEMPLTPTFFADHGEGNFSVEDSQKIYNKLLESQMISPKGLILSDPRDDISWEGEVILIFPNMNFTPNRSPIKELMNCAFAYHEISFAHLDSLVSFISSVINA